MGVWVIAEAPRAARVGADPAAFYGVTRPIPFRIPEGWP